MGRFADLCGEVAAALEENASGTSLALPPEAWDRFRSDWSDEDIEDAIGLVQESLMQDELVDAADSLSARMVDWLSGFGEAQPWTDLEGGSGHLSLDVAGQLTRRVARLEEALARYRDAPAPASPGFESLRRRLADQGIEEEMETARALEMEGRSTGEDEDEDDES
jgi:hypothetical protein